MIASKYLTRASPPRGANRPENRGHMDIGNDGLPYVSRRNSAGVYQWKPLQVVTSPRKRASSPKRKRATRKRAPSKKRSPKRARSRSGGR